MSDADGADWPPERDGRPAPFEPGEYGGAYDDNNMPPAEMREAARGLRQLFVALELEGFTPYQALTICGAALAAGQQQ